MKKSLLVFNFLILMVGFFISFNVVFAESDICTYDGFPVIFNYTITNGQLNSMCLDRDVNAMMLKIDAKQDGNLVIDIPRKAINAIISCEKDDSFFVLIDGEEVNYVETKTTEKFRRLSVSFTNNSQEIEIIGIIVGFSPFNCAHLYKNERMNITPLQQSKLGIKPQNIICEEGLELIFKSTNWNPACVKPLTTEKLIERRWAKPTEQIEKIENMQKFDTAFYTKIQKLIDDGETRYYSVVFFVNDVNKDKLEKVLIENHNATNVNKLSELSFVIAKVPIPEIPKLTDYDFVLQIGDGEEKVTVPEYGRDV